MPEPAPLPDLNDIPLHYLQAGMGKRFLNYLLDTIFMYIITGIIFFLAGIVLGLIYPAAVGWIGDNDKLANFILGFTISMFYYSAFESAGGQTLGKLITKTKVVNLAGEVPGLRIIIIRTLCRFIPFDGLSFLFGSGTGWHDTISKTMVITSERPKTNPPFPS